MENVIIVIILLGIVGGIVWYLRRAKKRGQGCIGCPCARQCQGHCDHADPRQSHDD